ncbi:MAG: hypothetical protein V3R36_05040, partial [Dehalococcoidales bacterium]
MRNKILMVFLALLIIISGGLSYYAYTVSRQVEILSDQLAGLSAEQAERIDTLSGELNLQKEEVLNRVGELESGINRTLGKIGGLESAIGGIDENRLQLGVMADDIIRSQDRARLLEVEIKETAELTKS